MEATSRRFAENADAALADDRLGRALDKLQREFRRDRRAMLARMPEFETLRDQARDVRERALAHLDHWLERFDARVTAQGGHVHWCADAAEARDTVLAICRAHGAKTAIKGKSMMSEEIALNDHLAANGIEAIETDLGEYILQLRRETPSHVVMPAIHLDAARIGDGFREHHRDLDPARPLDADAILAEARSRLRQRFVAAEIGITGANMLIAETGSIVLVTNEGNGDLTHTLAPVHIVLAGIEKVVPTVDDALALVRVLARSATTQEITSYTSIVTGPRRADEPDGAREFHVVLIDNGRSRLLGGPFRDILRCIRCGACQSLCPVYGAVGGHAYGWVYAGPVGAVLTPALIGIEAAAPLPGASTLCGQCEAVCPVRIPLPALLRRWREEAFARAASPPAERRTLQLWAWFARRPALYRPLLRLGVAMLSVAGWRKGRFRTLPLAAGWTASRDFPAPEGGTFVERWHRSSGAAR